MADDKARAEKLAAARKKAQKKAAEAKAKKGKAAPTKDDETPSASTDAVDEPKDEEAPPADEGASTPAEPEKEPEPMTAEAADEPAPTAAPSESTTALEAKLAELEKECAAAKSARDEAQLMSEALEKKVASLEMLHKEDESQISRLEKDLADARNETVDVNNKLQKSEAEVLRLSKKEAQDSGGTDNDHLDELEDEERKKLEGRIRELEAENTDLRRGIWVEKRKELQPGMDEAGGQFTNVDLGAMSPGTQRKHGGFGDFFTTGLNALTGAGGQHEHDEDGFLDDDDDFDEEAFRKAQEEAAKARIERIKEVKRGLTKWTDWRLDLVEGRSGGGEGIGEIFEV
ncbi:hypothetical protein N0V82_009796 [Gnomoniopsis sp. IMI 355080]|nr:hypothetical protein N0V82_009796 [Gnomoniopsis sp. IMI 355080]